MISRRPSHLETVCTACQTSLLQGREDRIVFDLTDFGLDMKQMKNYRVNLRRTFRDVIGIEGRHFDSTLQKDGTSIHIDFKHPENKPVTFAYDVLRQKLQHKLPIDDAKEIADEKVMDAKTTTPMIYKQLVKLSIFGKGVIGIAIKQMNQNLQVYSVADSVATQESMQYSSDLDVQMKSSH